jgi:predicted metal-dependent hydrolase
MVRSDSGTVTIRVRVGDSEIEVTGPKAYVEKKIDAFLKAPPSAIQQHPAHVTSQAVSTAEPTGKKISPAQFFKKCNPKTDVDRVLVAGSYLEQIRDARDFTAAEVRDIIKEAKWPPPINVNDAINRNIKKGFLMSAGDRENKRAFVLTSDGEELVKDLPSKG